MAQNSVETIKNAELQAETILLEANAKRLQILKSAQEQAGEASLKAFNQAEEEAQRILNTTRLDVQDSQKKALKVLEDELTQLRNQGKSRQQQAIDEILKVLPTLI